MEKVDDAKQLEQNDTSDRIKYLGLDKVGDGLEKVDEAGQSELSRMGDGTGQLELGRVSDSGAGDVRADNGKASGGKVGDYGISNDRVGNGKAGDSKTNKIGAPRENSPSGLIWIPVLASFLTVSSQIDTNKCFAFN